MLWSSWTDSPNHSSGWNPYSLIASCFVDRRSWRDSRDQSVESRSVLLRVRFDYSEGTRNRRWNLYPCYLNFKGTRSVIVTRRMWSRWYIWLWQWQRFRFFFFLIVIKFANWRETLVRGEHQNNLSRVLNQCCLFFLGKLDRCAPLRKWCVTSSSPPFLPYSSTEHRDHRSSTRTTKRWVILSIYLLIESRKSESSNNLWWLNYSCWSITYWSLTIFIRVVDWLLFTKKSVNHSSFTKILEYREI